MPSDPGSKGDRDGSSVLRTGLRRPRVHWSRACFSCARRKADRQKPASLSPNRLVVISSELQNWSERNSFRFRVANWQFPQLG